MAALRDSDVELVDYSQLLAPEDPAAPLKEKEKREIVTLLVRLPRTISAGPQAGFWYDRTVKGAWDDLRTLYHDTTAKHSIGRIRRRIHKLLSPWALDPVSMRNWFAFCADVHLTARAAIVRGIRLQPLADKDAVDLIPLVNADGTLRCSNRRRVPRGWEHLPRRDSWQNFKPKEVNHA